MVMVMLITCVVLRRLTDEVGIFQAESGSILFSLLVLEDEKEERVSLCMEQVRENKQFIWLHYKYKSGYREISNIFPLIFQMNPWTLNVAQNSKHKRRCRIKKTKPLLLSV